MKNYRLWSPADREQLYRLKREGFSRKEIAARLDRTVRAIKHMLEGGRWRP